MAEPRTTATKRIRWKERPYTSYSGHIGSVPGALFEITWKTSSADPNWVMTTTLPGMRNQMARHDDRAVLEEIAETWLDLFIHSLGAVWGH
jgi:hypothetical protein